ncbi:HAD-IIA family hydrolase [Corynebacterium phoceense]|uniref:HAD-IIA family hydrolase n=1 Tax=Corynebacterium phoceense TaxID=1686286 RepID=A0A540R506_9CORY|nr:HAD-IIA family hydrolase [Corynebacterium phoceense]MCQ9330788.1 HAD-IIA family hydrolase [Corynebacterium phoceense]MCQ9346692.1 HAD-IIA family hydrolase [Corynebacterium phoceense]MCQ9347852.1 HAD-IIA family hydrolase [Corynebacterium phoceense]TQE42484.1 HAD-IIA family hydrolase [Corynebacterium phoceense]
MSLLTTHDALLLDLDGTVWEGGVALPGVADVLNACGVKAIYVTNNASRAPEEVASMLRAIDIPADPEHVLTSAQAAVSLASQHIKAGSKVLVVGADSYKKLARDAGFEVVSSADDKPVAVLEGMSKDLGWRELSEAALAIRAGAQFFASNLDTSLPTERGLAVGNGALVAAITTSTGVEPLSAGKPGPEMFIQAAKMMGSSKPLAVGDRLDTDILGGNTAAMDTFHVLTGVSGPMALIEAPEKHRPDYIGATLADLGLKRAEARPGAQGGFTARVDGYDVLLEHGDEGATPTQALRTVLEVVWALPKPPRYIQPRSEAAERAVKAWW